MSEIHIYGPLRTYPLSSFTWCGKSQKTNGTKVVILYEYLHYVTKEIKGFQSLQGPLQLIISIYAQSICKWRCKGSINPNCKENKSREK